jgi:hypothetical protein
MFTDTRLSLTELALLSKTSAHAPEFAERMYESIIADLDYGTNAGPLGVELEHFPTISTDKSVLAQLAAVQRALYAVETRTGFSPVNTELLPAPLLRTFTLNDGREIIFCSYPPADVRAPSLVRDCLAAIEGKASRQTLFLVEGLHRSPDPIAAAFATFAKSQGIEAADPFVSLGDNAYLATCSDSKAVQAAGLNRASLLGLLVLFNTMALQQRVFINAFDAVQFVRSYWKSETPVLSLYQSLRELEETGPDNLRYSPIALAIVDASKSRPFKPSDVSFRDAVVALCQKSAPDLSVSCVETYLAASALSRGILLDMVASGQLKPKQPDIGRVLLGVLGDYAAGFSAQELHDGIAYIVKNKLLDTPEKRAKLSATLYGIEVDESRDTFARALEQNPQATTIVVACRPAFKAIIDGLVQK